MRFLFQIILIYLLCFSPSLFAEAPKITSSLTMQQLNKLMASDAAADDRFGISVAISGNTVVVGAYGDDCTAGNYCGAAIIYEFNAATGDFEQSAKLTASDRAEEDQFGRSVAISGDTVIVGAYLDDDAGDSSGSAYVFEKPGSGGWSNAIENAKLTASDGAAGDEFGTSVAVSDNIVVVGTDNNESAYLFEKPGSGGWISTSVSSKLTALDGVSGDNFGASVAISGDTVIVGAQYDDAGSAYVFEKPSSGGWVTATEDAKLTASDGVAGDRFGKSVAISGDTGIVGAHFDDDSESNSGSAYLFEKPVSGGWVTATEDAKLTPSDGAAGDYFGNSVAISDDMVIVGAYNKSGGLGSSYLFQKPVSGWVDTTQTDKLTASDGTSSDWFGASVAISGHFAIAGAYGDGESNSYLGSAYVFEAILTENLVENNSVILDIEASDAEGDTITFDIIDGADAARFNIDPVSGLLSFKAAPDFENPLDLDGDNIYEALLELSDNFESDTFKIFIQVSNLEYEGTAPKAISFSELNKITVSGSHSNVYISGSMVSVAISGNTAVIGSPGDLAAYIYEYQSDTNTFVQQARLTPTIAYTGFGLSVAISSDTVVVGQHKGKSSISGVNKETGLAYIFEKPSGGWSDMNESAKLSPSVGNYYDYFGSSVAISGDTVVVGARQADPLDPNDSFSNSGATYLFEKPAGGWGNATENARLTASDNAAGDNFGVSVAISGDTVIVGANATDVSAFNINAGTAYIYEKPVSGWITAIENAKLTPSYRQNLGYFGISVGMSGDTAIVGQTKAWDGVGFSGAAYLFEKPDSGGWVSATESATLNASDGVSNVGISVAISGDTAIVGEGYGSGAAYLFEKPVSGWSDATEDSKLTASDGASGDVFGSSVAIFGETAIIGAPQDNCFDDSPNCVSAYVFKTSAQSFLPAVITYLLF